MSLVYLAYGIAGFQVFRMTYGFVLRRATGWEDPDSREYSQKQIKKFLDQNKDAEVIKLPEGENYF